jgi:hypothetical protein
MATIPYIQQYVKYLFTYYIEIGFSDTVKGKDRKGKIGNTLGPEVFYQHAWANRCAAASHESHR